MGIGREHQQAPLAGGVQVLCAAVGFDHQLLREGGDAQTARFRGFLHAVDGQVVQAAGAGELGGEGGEGVGQEAGHHCATPFCK